MKFKIRVKDDDSEWIEEYNKVIVGETAQQFAERTIKDFNASLRPHETARELLEVIVEQEDNSDLHEWVKRANGMSVQFKGGICDLVYCKKCGVTGKRAMGELGVVLDSKYRRKVFRNCASAKIEMAKIGG